MWPPYLSLLSLGVAHHWAGVCTHRECWVRRACSPDGGSLSWNHCHLGQQPWPRPALTMWMADLGQPPSDAQLPACEGGQGLKQSRSTTSSLRTQGTEVARAADWPRPHAMTQELGVPASRSSHRATRRGEGEFVSSPMTPQSRAACSQTPMSLTSPVENSAKL